MFVKKSEVKAYLKEKGMRTSGDLFEELDAKIKEMLNIAVEEAKKKKMKTVKGRHLP